MNDTENNNEPDNQSNNESNNGSDNQNNKLEPANQQDISEWIKPDAPEGIIEAIREALSLRRVSMSYKAPLPLASEFRRYEEVLPGAANRILGMAEKALELTGEGFNVLRREINANTIVSIGMMGLTGFLAWMELPFYVIIPLGLSGILSFFVKDIFNKKAPDDTLPGASI